MADPFFRNWVERVDDAALPDNVAVLVEVPAKREVVWSQIVDAVIDHLVGLDLLEQFGFSNAAAMVRDRLPTRKRIQSGDVGEILGAELIDQLTSYSVPIKRLRHKPDRNAPMPGTDLIGICCDDELVRMLKGEAKSRQRLDASVVTDAADQLAKYNSRPNPGTLSFIADRLIREGRTKEWRVVDHVQTSDLDDSQIEHLIFTVSGNDPAPPLATASDADKTRHLVGLSINDHSEFISDLFEEIRASFT